MTTATRVVHRNIDVRLNVLSRWPLGGAGEAYGFMGAAASRPVADASRGGGVFASAFEVRASTSLLPERARRRTPDMSCSAEEVSVPLAGLVHAALPPIRCCSKRRAKSFAIMRTRRIT